MKCGNVCMMDDPKGNLSVHVDYDWLNGYKGVVLIHEGGTQETLQGQGFEADFNRAIAHAAAQQLNVWFPSNMDDMMASGGFQFNYAKGVMTISDCVRAAVDTVKHWVEVSQLHSDTGATEPEAYSMFEGMIDAACSGHSVTVPTTPNAWGLFCNEAMAGEDDWEWDKSTFGEAAIEAAQALAAAAQQTVTAILAVPKSCRDAEQFDPYAVR